MKLACKDISPDTTCDFEVTSDTAADAAAQMLVHAHAEHAADIAGQEDAAVLAMFETKVHE